MKGLPRYVVYRVIGALAVAGAFYLLRHLV
ncbi:MAG: hypothetical protein JWQ90_2555 [Hydrocarboniphaga sp.]|nr:hypothetical protein [Hydrocarboniphaga sp.]